MLVHQSVLVVAMCAAFVLPAYGAVHSVKSNDSAGLEQVFATAQTGDTVVLPSGTYTGNYHIRVSLALMAENPQKPAILSGNGSGNVLEISAPDVEVRGLVLQDSGSDISAQDACVLLQPDATGATIQNNHFRNCTWGVWVQKTHNVHIVGNNIVGTDQRILSDRGNGIHLFAAVGGFVAGNQIRMGRDGVYISNSTHVTIQSNVMRDTRFGIHYMYSHSCTVASNTTESSSIGAAIMYSKHLEIRGNNLYRNQDQGVLLRDVLFSNIVGNISAYNGTGVYLGSSYNNTVSENRIYRNDMAMHISNGSSRNEVYLNDFIENRMQVKFLDKKTIRWGHEGQGNFWSNYAGWDSDRNGIGDRRFVVTQLADKVVYQFPVLRMISRSPAFTLLRKIGNQFPVLDGAVVVDEYPLMHRVTESSSH